jgi:hypothetical protein
MPQINIKTLDGQKKPFQVEETDTVAKLKETLAEKVRAHRPLSLLSPAGCRMPHGASANTAVARLRRASTRR